MGPGPVHCQLRDRAPQPCPRVRIGSRWKQGSPAPTWSGFQPGEAVAIIATVGFGVVLGRYRGWTDVLKSAVLGTGALAVMYVAAMLAQSDADSNDNAAGAGLVILAPLTFIVIAFLLSVGAGLGCVGRGWRSKRPTG